MSNVKQIVVNELHKSARRNFPRRKVRILGLNDLNQIDLISLIPYAKFNRGHKYILVSIDTFSKYVWAKPLKQKNGKEVADAMKKILNDERAISKNLQSDR